MTTTDFINPSVSIKLLCLDNHFNEMIRLYDSKKFPKVLLLSGKKGVGKFTLAMHFLNYIYTKNEKESYNIEDKKINTESIFYNQLISNINQNVLLIKTEENKNIKIEDIRKLKTILSRSSLSDNSRFIVIDEVEFMNENSANALLKPLEEPSDNNFFILINNQQANLIETISSRSLKNNIFLSTVKSNDVINYLVNDRVVENLLTSKSNLSPGQFFEFNKIFSKYKMNKNDNIFDLLNILISAYKKEKDKSLINLIYYLIDCSFFDKIKNNKKNIDFLLNTKSSIVKIIHNFVQFNINIASVLNSIKVKLNNV
jgi:DNA polymerase-3 subunit delta'